MDSRDREIINRFQGGFPLSERPYRDAAEMIGIDEQELISRIRRLLADGVLSRFGPMYHAERMGGGLTLAAMQVPLEDFERVCAIVNAMPEVAHNYERTHALNMWFVIATERQADVADVIARIERETGLEVYDMPKQREFFIGLKLEI